MLLDVTSIAPASVLVLDSYFYVVVFHGTTVATWRKAEYHLNPEHAAFAQLLEVLLFWHTLVEFSSWAFLWSVLLQQKRRIHLQNETTLCWLTTMLMGCLFASLLGPAV